MDLYSCVCTRQSINQILSEKPTEIPYVYIFMRQYANLTSRVIIKQIAQFDPSEQYLKDHTQSKYEIYTNGNGSGSTYITIKQRFLKDHLYTMSEKHNFYEQALKMHNNRSSSTYITMKQRFLKYSIKTTYILCLKSTTCTSKLKHAQEP